VRSTISTLCNGRQKMTATGNMLLAKRGALGATVSAEPLTPLKQVSRSEIFREAEIRGDGNARSLSLLLRPFDVNYVEFRNRGGGAMRACTAHGRAPRDGADTASDALRTPKFF